MGKVDLGSAMRCPSCKYAIRVNKTLGINVEIPPCKDCLVVIDVTHGVVIKRGLEVEVSAPTKKSERSPPKKPPLSSLAVDTKPVKVEKYLQSPSALAWKCRDCPTMISGSVSKRYCVPCRKKRRNEQSRKRVKS